MVACDARISKKGYRPIGSDHEKDKSPMTEKKQGGIKLKVREFF